MVQMIALAKELNEARPPDDMTDEEWAFYQALAMNESAVRAALERVIGQAERLADDWV